MQESNTIAYMTYMKVLKTLTWEDNWKKYMYAPFEKGVLMGVLNLMIEFSKEEYGYTVYEAFLKATEIKASSYTLNCDNTILHRLIEVKKQDIKNIKKGIFDEELKAYIGALETGYKYWLEHPYTPYN